VQVCQDINGKRD